MVILPEYGYNQGFRSRQEPGLGSAGRAGVKRSDHPMRRDILFLALACALGRGAFALGPHEILLLVNRDSPASVEVADKFARLRSVPAANIVELPLPGKPGRFPIGLTRADFTRLIWAPATKAARQQGIQEHILAWVYSVDFPTTITTAPPVSILGLTFIRNDSATLAKSLVALAEVEKTAVAADKDPARRDIADAIKELYVSPLFAGPDSTGLPPHFSQTLDVYQEWLGRHMPLPSMMLGYIGERGSTKQMVIQCLERGAASDSTRPEGTVFFVTNNDVRSKCRAWQYPLAAQELRAAGVRALITDRFPSGRRDVMGLMTGAARIDTQSGNTFLPGAVADHLTSHAGDFGVARQSKLTEWIQAGCAASAGTVTEPVSVWAKFPTARFFVHYAAGCALLEGFFQSIRCPLQILLVGDPLAQPWAPAAELVLHGLGKEAVSGTVRISAEVKADPSQHYAKCVFLLDGKTVGHGKALALDTSSLKNGTHSLRAVAYRTGLVRSQVFRKAQLEVQH